MRPAVHHDGQTLDCVLFVVRASRPPEGGSDIREVATCKIFKCCRLRKLWRRWITGLAPQDRRSVTRKFSKKACLTQLWRSLSLSFSLSLPLSLSLSLGTSELRHLEAESLGV